MFNRSEILDMGCVESAYTNLYIPEAELLYLLTYLYKKTGIKINANFNTYQSNSDWLHFNNIDSYSTTEMFNNFYIFKIYKKTRMDLTDSGYTKIADIVDKEVALYYNAAKNNLALVMIRQYITWTNYGTPNYKFLIPGLLLYMMKDHKVEISNDHEYLEFCNHYTYDAGMFATNKEIIKNWLTRNFRRTIQNSENEIERFFSSQVEAKIKSMSESIDSYNRTLARLLEDYNRTYSTIRTMNEELLALKNKKKTDAAELFIKAFEICKNNVSMRGISGNDLTFDCTTYISTFDADAAKVALRNSNYCLYQICSPKFSIEDRKKICSMIFCEEPRYRIRIKQAFAVSPSGILRVCRNTESGNFISNPHLAYFSCFGANGPYITKAFVDGEFDQGLLLTLAACANVNIIESPTMSKLYIDMFVNYAEKSYLEDIETGELLTPAEVLEQENMTKAIEEQTNDNAVGNREEIMRGAAEWRAEHNTDPHFIGTVNWNNTDVRVDANNVNMPLNNVIERTTIDDVVAQAIDDVANGIGLDDEEETEEEEQEFVPTFNRADRNMARVTMADGTEIVRI